MSLTIDDVKSLLAQQTKELQASISSAVQTEVQALGNELKSSFSSEIARIDQRINDVQQQYVNEIASLRSSVDKCSNQSDNSDDDYVRMTKMNSLKLSGLAHSTNENLHETFTKIAQLISFDVNCPTNVPELLRLTKRTRTNDLIPIPTIIMKFVAKHIRDKFYGLYLSRLPGKTMDWYRVVASQLVKT